MQELITYISKHIYIQYIVISFIIIIITYVKTNKKAISFLTGYCFLVIAETILTRPTYLKFTYRTKLFWSYTHWEEKNQIIMNILIFIPIGISGWFIWKRKTVLYSFIFSLIIETVQLITKKGMFEFDDIFHNTLGTIIGMLIALCITKCFQVFNKKDENNSNRYKKNDNRWN